MTKVKNLALALTLAVVFIVMTTVACISQNTLATLLTVLGNATSSIAAIEGNTTLATQIKADTAAAIAAVLAWKSGSPATEAIEALNIVEDDLNLFPATGPYVELIDYGIGTVEGILALLPQTTTPHTMRVRRTVAPVHVAKWHDPATEFKLRWNKIVATDSMLAPVAIK